MLTHHVIWSYYLSNRDEYVNLGEADYTHTI